MVTELSLTPAQQHNVSPPVTPTPSVCECVYEYNDDHHGLLVWQCPFCNYQEEQPENHSIEIHDIILHDHIS